MEDGSSSDDAWTIVAPESSITIEDGTIKVDAKAANVHEESLITYSKPDTWTTSDSNSNRVVTWWSALLGVIVGLIGILSNANGVVDTAVWGVVVILVGAALYFGETAIRNLQQSKSTK